MERKLLVFGSLNIDRTYRVEHLAGPGETISAREMNLFCGGKGFNQAIALSRAGNEVWFAGAVGEDGRMLTEKLTENGIRTEFVETLPGSSGHAVIQVDDRGENNIIILAGSNGKITEERIDQVLTRFEAGDLIVMQNEISNGAFLLHRAKERGMITALNPSPADEKIRRLDLAEVDWLLINEHEGATLTGQEQPEEILQALHEKYPAMNMVLTLGEKGSQCMTADGNVTRQTAMKTEVVDTTAAGDTFTGYFLSGIMKGNCVAEALRMASIASGIAVSRAGAEPSVPELKEVEARRWS